MDILDWFPEGEILEHPVQKAGTVTLALPSHRWLLLPEEQLTDREQRLLQLLTDQVVNVPTDPWYRYLLEGQGDLPIPLKKIQVLHCHLTHAQAEGLASWLEMMRLLFPNYVTDFQVGSQDILFILDQSQFYSVAAILRDTLSAMEYDFNLGMVLVLGQVWPIQAGLPLTTLVQAERAVIQTWGYKDRISAVHRFSQLYLWALNESIEELATIKQGLHQLISSQDQLEEIILALWDNAAVVTKAAQQLYLHRNSLQYKIDKWEELTGLSLKELTDLSLCYQVILEDYL